MNYKKILDIFVNHPLLTSLMIATLALLIFMRTLPWFISFPLLAGLIAMSMFFGQKLEPFKLNKDS
jgi:hypothetical protein